MLWFLKFGYDPLDRDGHQAGGGGKQERHACFFWH
jgi:hypothetical protein